MVVQDRSLPFLRGIIYSGITDIDRGHLEGGRDLVANRFSTINRQVASKVHYTLRENGSVLTNVSYWRIVWSPAGAGQVCYLTTGDGKSAGDLRIALVDNRTLYDCLTREIMTTIDPSISQRPFTVVQATFNDPGEGSFDAGGVMAGRTVTLKSPTYAVAFVWRDFSEPYQIDLTVGKESSRLAVTSLFIPAKSAEVVINGKKSAGNVYPTSGIGRSSAFLAFSESWLKWPRQTDRVLVTYKLPFNEVALDFFR